MAFDSTVRLKQINNPELSGYILNVIGVYLPGVTGIYTGVFYPLTGNPSGFIGTGVTGQFANATVVTGAINNAIAQVETWVGLNYVSTGTSGSFGAGFALLSGTNKFTQTNIFTGITNFSGQINITGASAFNFTNGAHISSGGTLTDSSNYLSVDWNNRNLCQGSFGYITAAWGSCFLSDLNVPSIISVDWHNRIAYNADNYAVLNWSSQTLSSESANAITVDWGNRVLSGNWLVSNLSISGSPVVTAAQTGFLLTGNYAQLGTSNTFTGTTQNISGVLDVRAFHNTGNYSNFQIPSGYASILMMSGLPLIARTNGGVTSYYSSYNNVILETIYNSGSPITVPFNYYTQLTVNSTSGTMGFLTLDGTNDGQVSLGTAANQQTVNITGNRVGIGVINPIYQLDVGFIGCSTGKLGMTGVGAIYFSGDNFTSGLNISNGYCASGTTKILDWVNRMGYSSVGNPILNWERGQMNDLNGAGSMDAGQRLLMDNNFVTPSLDWQNRLMYDAAQFYSIDYTNRILYDHNEATSMNYDGRKLYNGDGSIPLDWGNRILSGNWIIQNIITSISKVSGAFSISSTGASTYLVNTLQTGLSGIFISPTGTFPNASGLSGVTFTIKDWKGNSNNNPIILTGVNNETFDGQPYLPINIAYLSYNILSDGQNWVLV